MIEDKATLKKCARMRFNNNHKDNKNQERLMYDIKAENGQNMARHGWQLSDDTVQSVYQELLIELTSNP